MQRPISADGAAAIGVGHAVQVGEPPAGFFDDDLKGSQIPQRHHRIEPDIAGVVAQQVGGSEGTKPGR